MSNYLQHFIPVSFEAIQPLCKPTEAAERIATEAGAPAMFKRIKGDVFQTFLPKRALSADYELTRAAAVERVALALLRGSLPSFVQAVSSGSFFRIPLGYWVAKSGSDNPWVELDTFMGLPIAAGHDDSMVGQPVLVSQEAADALFGNGLRAPPKLEKKKVGWTIADAPLVERMRQLVLSGECSSPTAAAWTLVDEAKGGTADSRVRRLQRRYDETYPSA
jgi:hypothetical protein